MKLMKLPSEFQKALPILKKIKEAGFEAYFVGGGVRDILLDRPIHDVDIATSSYPEETKAIFSRTVDIGIEHGTVLVLENDAEYEITTFRTEDIYVDYRRPSNVSFVRSLEEDLKRRDFTVNALALDETGQVIDKFHGIQDLKRKELRAVGKAEERFQEDALRIMRGFRFAASLDFKIEDETFEAMKTHAHLLQKISVERSFIELDKLFMAPNWKLGLTYFIEAQAYNYLPGLENKQSELTAMMDHFDAHFVFDSSEQAWANMIIALSLDKEKAFLKSWKTSNDFQKQVTQIVTLYRKRESALLSKMDLYVYGKEAAIFSENLRKAKGLPTDFNHMMRTYDDLTIYDKHEIVVNGRYLMEKLNMKAGPQLGHLLKKVEKAIVEGTLANKVGDIEAFIMKELENE
ncbi:CCA tRNA nucleotidyltransferase [Streptococcus uberis]|nr:CCA tRNA nucleotidyltransferase [Streptococcus uberis]MCK1199761.1 CCA tRNA nucleotidyltransferase [Streptococcus uberis]MCK1205155.1 CCA tRNA nucleotidyltransferase [Streptococcus uberis]